MSKFEKKLKEMDPRSELANRVCRLLYKNNKGDLEKEIKDGDKIFTGFDDVIRNFYELENEIPLYHLYCLKKEGAENLDLTDEEFISDCKEVVKKCHELYS